MTHFGDLTWQEFGQRVPRDTDRVLLPVGTLEAHGVTPLGTDNIIPEYLFEQIAGDLGALVAPTVNYGITRSLTGFPGSFGVRPEIFRDYVLDILLGLHASGFRRIAVMNGHGGNNAMLKEAAYRFFDRTGAQVCVVHWWMFCSDVCRDVFGQAGGHAACDETAMVMAAHPELVKAELYSRDLAFEYHAAVDIYPAPSSIMLYTPGEGHPDFDRDRCHEYARRATAKVHDFLKGLWQAWDRMLRPIAPPG
jgi:creatinine amidohydrolase